jgi:hypothetical protein
MLPERGKLKASKQCQVTSKHPTGYDEIGESLAQPVAEGFRKVSWAYEIAKVLGYRLKDVKAWVEFYEQKHAAELKRLRKGASAKRFKVEGLRDQAQGIVLGLDAEARRLQD